MWFLFIFVSLGVYIREVEDPFWDVKSRSLEDLRPVSDFIGWKVFVKEEELGTSLLVVVSSLCCRLYFILMR